MPYSERLQLVHVAIPKTGTTSVIRALHDLHVEHGGKLTLLKDEIDRTFRRRHGLDALGDPRPGRAKHLSALQLKTILGERYAEAFSFSFVRNPWAREVSRYRFTHVDSRPGWFARLRRGTRRNFHRLSFEQWVRRRAREAERRGGIHNQIDKLIDADGRILVDFVGRLESVDEGFAHVCERAGLPPRPVPHVNGTGQGSRYREYYEPWSRDLVGELYRRDVEAFGYEFGG